MRWHTARVRDDGAGAAERVLRTATDREGRGALPWLASPLANAHRVLDLATDSALSGELGDRWIGVGRRPERPLTARGLFSALPVRGKSVDAVTLPLVLPFLTDLDAVFAEIRRVLRPGGMVVAVVPSISVRSPAELRLRPLLAPVLRGTWPNRSALDHLGWLFAAADFAVMGDDRVPFAVPLPDPAAAHRLVVDLPDAGIWPPDAAPEARVKVAEALSRRAGPTRVLPVPLRRLVARR